MADFWDNTLWPILTHDATLKALQSILLIVALLLIIAYLLLMDRKVWAAVQLRRGPNVVGAFGLLQSFADLLKFAFKEPVIPASADKIVFLLAPLITTTTALARSCRHDAAREPICQHNRERLCESDVVLGD